MSRVRMEIPDFLPCKLSAPPTAMFDIAWNLYKQNASLTEELQNCRKQAAEEVEAGWKKIHHTLAQLAAERFEFERVMERTRADLGKNKLRKLKQILNLHRKRWDNVLKRLEIEIVDLQGMVLSEELAAVIEVESAVPNSKVTETTVRETLSPLIKMRGELIGIGRVVTSVPVVVCSENKEEK